MDPERRKAMATQVAVGQYWKSAFGVIIKVLTLVEDPPEDDLRKAGNIQLQRVDNGYRFWDHEVDLRIKCVLIPESDVPLVLLGGC